MMDRLAVQACVLAASLAAGTLHSTETDQYFSWGREIEDSAAVLNAKLNSEIEHAAERVNSRSLSSPAPCEQVAKQVMDQLHFNTFQDFEVWVVSSPLVARIPASGEEEDVFRETNIYHVHGPLDTGMWLPIMPTVEVGGIRFGTDKLSHMVSSGWRWYRLYRRELEDGVPEAEAELRVIREGVTYEETGLGGWTSGVISMADLEANYQGMLFYDSLCYGGDPILELDNGSWRRRRDYDISTAVAPEWDESYNPSFFRAGRWRKVAPQVREYCQRLDEPSVKEKRWAYRSVDTVTPVEAVVLSMIRDGEMEDPRPFSIDEVCAREPSAEIAPTAPPPLSASLPSREMVERVREFDGRLTTRRVGLLGLHLARPERIAASVGLLFAPVPKNLSCTYVCGFEGAFVQLGAGMSGGRLSAGWARVVGEGIGNRLFLTDVLVGFAVKGSVLTTWYEPHGAEAGQWYLGGEAEYTVARVNFRLGVFYQVSGAGQENPWMLSTGIGWGF